METIQSASKKKADVFLPHLFPGEDFTVFEPVSAQFRQVFLESEADLGCTERIRSLRRQYFRNVPVICLERARAYTRVYQGSEGEPQAIRRGKAFKEYCLRKSIVIQDDELIIGNPGSRPKYAMVAPDYAWEWVLDELDTMSFRPQDPYLISEEQKAELREDIIPYWKGRSVHEAVMNGVPSDTRHLVFGTNFAGEVQKSLRGVGHNAAGMERLVRIGFQGVEEEARRTLDTLSFLNPEDHEKIHFLQGVIFCCEGMKILGERHSEAAAALAERTDDPGRKKELLGIAEVCSRVPYRPARTFHEAAQLCWFVQMGTKMVQCGASFGLGRFDQYMLPFYRADLAESRLDGERALEIMECLWIKNAEVIPIEAEKTATYVAGYMVTQMVTIGGVNREGENAVNELSYLCLQATKDVRLVSPSLAVRYNRNLPVDFLKRAIDVVKIGGGMPQFHNDEVGIRMMLSSGVSVEDAYDFEIRGCSESMIGGKMWKYSDAGPLNLAACLEWALFDGWSLLVPSETRWGLATGDAETYGSYEEVLDAFKRQVSFLTEHVIISTIVIERSHAEICPEPYVSSLIEGPLESGVDYLKGGARYNVGPAPQFTGIADVANSLAVIKKFVFDEKSLSMNELLSAMKNNFESRESLRHRVLNRCPKYGWDDDYVDSIAREVADFCSEEVLKYKTYRGCKAISGLYPVSGNTPLGMAVGALSSGRKAGVPLAEGISPQQGTDRTPTEVIKSVTSYDHARHQDGGMLNLKFNPSIFDSDKGKDDLLALIRTYMDRGGWHIQFNVVDNELLRKAQADPQNYPTLLVRVAGYSAYFTSLSTEVQNDIISRNEYGHF